MKVKSTIYLIACIILFSYLLSCSTPSNISAMESILNKTWKLNSLNGEKVDSTNYMNGKPFITFSSDGKLNGSTGCNRFNGSYKNEEGKITLDPGAMTRMYCPGSGEQDFITALSAVNNLKLKDKVLVVSNGDKEVMEFESSDK